jgi:DNA invertase Pin-like site-specific DNA recombinase
MTTSTIGYSYLRYSSPEQGRGDSVRRQTTEASAWCERNQARLDTATSLHDLGKSAFLGEHRKNADRYALAAFLRMVEQGKVPRGSYLIVESLDRLTREHIQPALLLVLNLLQAGVRIVQLKPAEIVYDDQSEAHAIMLMIIELMRGHSESKMKSQRVGSAWGEKRRRAQAGEQQRETNKMGKGKKFLTRRLPAWVEEGPDGKLRLIPERAAVVKKIFRLTIDGRGLYAVVKKLNEDKDKPFVGKRLHPLAEGEVRRRPGWSGKWYISYVHLILTDRRAVGELQPRGPDGAEDGPAVSGYYPSVVSEAEWQRARAATQSRRQKAGKIGVCPVNVLQGLLKDAGAKDAVYSVTKEFNKGQSYRVLRSSSWRSGGRVCSFRFDVFDQALLSELREIDPRQLLGEDTTRDEVLVLSGRLARLEERIRLLEEGLAGEGDVVAGLRALKKLEAEQKELANRLAEARCQAANPISEAWGEACTVLEVLREAPEPNEIRLRLRGILRTLVESAWLLVVPRGRTRLAAVQLFFYANAQGEVRARSYLICYQAALKQRPAAWWAKSFADVFTPADLDLRRKQDVVALEELLGSLDLAKVN